ncbi:MAG TPA: sulfotransferase family protein [Phycisphaerae bacterium]|nr:sulfotransferase family protein [Phycisphaerae bacterium]HNU46453.1 sulfotransferase family protein [Phycisphaerae bacterium]
MMQMLEAGGLSALTDGIRTADEDNPRGYYEFEAVKKTKADPSWLARASGKVVKMVYMLLYDLPPDRVYRVVFMQRQLEEVIRSQDVMLQHSGKPGGNLDAAQLLRVFQAQLDKCYQWLAAQPNFRVHYVHYNELLREPLPPIRALSDFLGGLNQEAMARVIDPTLYRQRES